MSNVVFEVRDHVARVTLNRPAAMNAVDLETEAELERVWTAIEADRDIRVVVLTGTALSAPAPISRIPATRRASNTGRRRGPAASAASHCVKRSMFR